MNDQISIPKETLDAIIKLTENAESLDHTKSVMTILAIRFLLKTARKLSEEKEPE